MTTTFSDLNIDHKRSKGIESVLCPKCSSSRKPQNRKTPCLNLNHDEKWWRCWNCEWKGSIQNDENSRKVKEKGGYQEEIKPYTHEFVKYWEGRGISQESLQKAHIYQRDLKFPHIDRNRLIPTAHIPIYKDYAVVNIKMRSLVGKGMRQVSKQDGASIEFIGWERFDEEKDSVVLYEGEVDMLTGIEIGMHNCLSVPNGAMNPDSNSVEGRMEFLNQYALTKLKNIKTIYLALDDDINGKTMRDELARRLGRVRCRIVTYDGLKDMNDLLVQKGAEACQNAFKNAKPFPIAGIITVTDVSDSLYRIREKGYERGLLIGNHEIDKLHSVKFKSLTTLTGWPSSGKTTWMRWYLTELINNNPKEHIHVVMYDPEGGGVERTVSLIMQVRTKKRFGKNEWNSMTEVEYQEAKQWTQDHFTFLTPFDMKQKKINLYGREINAPNSHTGILELTKVCVEQKGANIIMIDSYAKIDFLRGRSSETDYISKMLDDQHEFNDRYGMYSVMVAHPSKPTARDNAGNFEIPDLSNCSGSQHWSNKSISGIVVHRNKWELDETQNQVINTEAPTIIKVVKQKYLEQGQEGITQMHYDFWQGENFISDPSKKKRIPGSKKEVEKDVQKQKEVNADQQQTTLIPNTKFDEDISDMPF